MSYTDLWPLIQQDILGAIQADNFLGTRVGVALEPGDIQSTIDMKLAKAIGAGLDGKNGVGFLVLPIEKADDDNSSMPGGPLKLTIVVDWCENVIINNSLNGTQTPIRVYAALTEKILKLYTPVGLTQSLIPSRPVISEFTDPMKPGLRIGRVEFTAVEADFTPFTRTSRPQITVTGSVQASASSPNSYQLTGAASVAVMAPTGSVVYYTTDGTHPYQGNATAQIYSGLISIAQPCLFRARAFVANQTGSDTAAANFWQ